MTEKQPSVGIKLSQAAPTVPQTKEELKKEVCGVISPLSAATVPSVYNKKLTKLFRGRLLTLTGDFTVSEALRKMARFNVSSVPVLKGKNDNTILGFVDMLDFLAYLNKLMTKEEGKEIGEKERLRSISENFGKTCISELIDKSGRNPFKFMNGNESLAEAVEYCLKGVHRIAITDDDGDLIGVISQWTVANYLATVPTDDKEWILKDPVSKARFTSELITVNLKDIAIHCFQKMYANNLSAIAVVDDSGRLCGNLSASDLKGFQLFLEDFSDLLHPVSEFLSIIRKRQRRPADFVVTVTQDTLMKDAIFKLNQEIVHRVYIVDENKKPIGVISLTDIMQQLIVDTHSIPTFAKSTAMANVSQ